VRRLLLLISFAGLAAGARADYSIPGISSDQITMPVNVWGEVRTPGLYMVPWDSDLRDALSAAGGPTSTANLSSVRIVTPGLEIRYDLSAFLSGRGASLPPLEPGSTVYVARSNYEWWKDLVDFGYKLLVIANVIWIMGRS
jgi:protein involved in polysaccharide export with SLBB domain